MNIDRNLADSATAAYSIKCTQTVESVNEKPDPNINFSYDANSGIVQLDFGNDFFTTKDVGLFNIQGELLLSQTTTQSAIKLNIEKYPQGVYFVRIEAGMQVWVRKIIKN
jgi:hypothetical protein